MIGSEQQTVLTSLSDLLPDPGPARLLVAPASSGTACPTLGEQQQLQQPPRTLPKPLTQQPPPTLPKPPPDLQPQPPPTLPKPALQAPQSHLKLQTFSQPLPKPYLQASRAQVPPQTPPKPQSLPQALVRSYPLTLDQSGDVSSPGVLPGDPLSPTESGDALSEGMSSKQMSIKER